MKGSRNERGVGESTFAMSYVMTTGEVHVLVYIEFRKYKACSNAWRKLCPESY